MEISLNNSLNRHTITSPIKNMSLSMKLRSNSTQIRPLTSNSFNSNNNSPNSTYNNNNNNNSYNDSYNTNNNTPNTPNTHNIHHNNLPRIKSRQNNNYNYNNSSNNYNTNNNIHLKKVISKSDVSKLYNKLSDSFHTGSYETYPNRETINHPITLCVRCSSHASLCVPCADNIAQDSVEFFRRSQAVGAYKLFDGAIKQAGCEKILRFTIFRTWKNSIQLRKYGRMRRSNDTEKRYRDLILRDPFRSWVKYTRECQIERRDKKEQQLEERIKVLEQQLSKYAAEKSVIDKQIRNLQIAKSDGEEEIIKLKKIIKENEEIIHEERTRVLKLTKVFEEVSPKLLETIKLSIQPTLATTLRHINLTSNFHLTSLNLTRLLKSTKSSLSSSTSSSSSSSSSTAGASTTTTTTTRRSIRDTNPRLSSISKPPPLIETGPIPPEGSTSALLLSWLNSISKSVNGLTIPIESSTLTLSLDDYLPPFEELRSLETLKNCRQLSRVIFRLIALSLSSANIMSSSSSSLSSSSNNNSSKVRQYKYVKGDSGSSSLSSSSIDRMTITTERMEVLKGCINKPNEFLPLLFQYLKYYFDVTDYPLENILNGQIEYIELLLCNLLVIWSNLNGHVLYIDEKNEIQKLIERQSKYNNEIELKINEINHTNLIHTLLKYEPNITTIITNTEIETNNNNINNNNNNNDSNQTQNPINELKHILSIDFLKYLQEDTYQIVASSIDNYFKLNGPEQLLDTLNKLMNDINVINEFNNTVYTKEKLAVNNIQYLIDTQRKLLIQNIKNTVTSINKINLQKNQLSSIKSNESNLRQNLFENESKDDKERKEEKEKEEQNEEKDEKDEYKEFFN